MKPLAKLKEKDGKKYFQTLEGHTYDALKIYKAYLEKHSEVLESFCKHWKIDKETFTRNLFVAIYLHDIGKLTEQFQENIRNGKSSSSSPHAYFFLHLFKEFPTKQILDVPIEISAILGHHTQLYSGIYNNDENFKLPKFLEKNVNKFIDDILKVYKELNFDKHFVFDKIENFKIEKYRSSLMRKIRKKLIVDSSKYKDKIRLKSVFSYFYSILQTCDDYSSADFVEYIEKNDLNEQYFDSIIKKPYKYVPKIGIMRPIQTILRKKEPYPFQKEIHELKAKNILLFAPCGRGKTEAALLWAIQALGEYKKNKIIFAMPTQTTSNAMWERLCKIFGEENVSLFHGKSFIKLKSKLKKKEEEIEEKDYDEIRDETFKGKVFFKPITVTTIDHVLLSFVHGFSQADFALGNLMNSVIIFDEVHYYEKITLEHLVTLFKKLNKMDIPHFLMSGTLPEFLINEVEKFGEYNFIIDKEGLEFKPFEINFLEKNLINEAKEVDTDTLNEIIMNFKNGLRQFIILNTIERTKIFYNALKNKVDGDKLVLYHSQFTFKDRTKKEEEILNKEKSKPFILVATQVIEVSLDISCDIMYTELVPPDALGQRAGRLNRKGTKWFSNGFTHKLNVYIPQKNLPYSDEVLDKSLNNIKKYCKPCSYKDIKLFCDEVYFDYLLEIESDLDYYFKKNTLFGISYKDMRYSEEETKLFNTRDEKIQKIEVVPECYYSILGEKALTVEHQAKIPLYLLQNEIRNFGKLVNFNDIEKKVGSKVKRYLITTFPYSYSLGFSFENRIATKDNII